MPTSKTSDKPPAKGGAGKSLVLSIMNEEEIHLFIRPQRYRMVLSFLLGLVISIGLIIIAFFYYRSNQAKLAEDLRKSISEQLEAEFAENHPLTLVYVFAKDKKAGETISDTDLTAAEVPSGTVPADAVANLEEAVGLVVRCDIPANTVASKALFFNKEEYPDDLRVMEYTILNLPEKLENGNYLDVRVMFPNGLDYIVLSKKKVIDQTRGEVGQPDYIWLHLNEEEILRMSSAIVDASLIEGSILYAVTYVAPDIQKEAIKTYPANHEVLELIKANPNIVTKAVEALEERNREAFEERINKELKQAGKSEAFGDNTYAAQPVYAAPQSTSGEQGQQPQNEASSAQTQESQDAGGSSESVGLDGRL